ncbi:hypothetical protein DSL72_006921 [Monilinia vaccinii-corymbosi]|uniref:Mid2 domain-containing protein n=1 Tax=Monilinia vaccinii-corymbosi TaxID=61207 RepID=A0A8A3PLF8_9HELO|nr:hypothetical protein DSL72_006921 [Monilinia vaccinii-corymbosi]
MRPPLWLFVIWITGVFSFLGIAEDPASMAVRSLITLTSITTVLPLSATPSPIIVTESTRSSSFVVPTTDNPSRFYITAAVVIIWTSYQPNDGKPIALTSTDYRTFSVTTSVNITFATLATETESLPMPAIRSISQTTSSLTGNIGTGLITSHSTPPAASATSKKSSTPVSSSRASSLKASSSATASNTPTSTPLISNDHKPLPVVAIIVSTVVGALFFIVAIGFLICCLRRRNLKKQKTSDPMELPDRVFDGQIACRNIGNRVSCYGREGPQDRRSIMDTLGLTEKKLWPSWPFGDRAMGTAPIKNAIMGAALPISSAPSRPIRPYEETSNYVASPRAVELPADPVISQYQHSYAQESTSGHGISVVPPIPSEAPEGDLMLQGNNNIGEETQPRWSNYDGNNSTQDSELHGASASPPAPTIARSSGDNKELHVYNVPGNTNSVATTWNEPGSKFSITSSTSSSHVTKSSNGGNSSIQTSPNNWVEPTASSGIFNRSRSFNAIAPTISEADTLRTVAERDNALALLEGREKVHTTARISSVDHQEDQRQFIKKALETRQRKSEERSKEIAARFPFVEAPLPGTVSAETHDVSYTQTEDGVSVQRVNKNNGHGGWI